MLEALEHSFFETLNILPVLFIVYFVINLISHSENFNNLILKSKKFGPLIGGALGIFPQCGFSSAIADMYNKKYVTIGTLFAVFIATSDEAVVVLITFPNFITNLLLLIAYKFIFAVIIGYIIDFIINKKVTTTHSHHLHHHHNCNILLEATGETLKVGLYLFIATFVINYILSLFSLKTLSNFIGSNIFLQPLITSLIGLIPSCASSVFLVTLYVENIIYFGSLVGGLSAGSGVGLLVLFKNGKNLKHNLIITLSLILIGTLIGVIINLLNLLF